jgi:hypothetical protein
MYRAVPALMGGNFRLLSHIYCYYYYCISHSILHKAIIMPDLAIMPGNLVG